MKCLFFLLCGLVIQTSCQPPVSQSQSGVPGVSQFPAGMVAAQGRALNDSRIPQRDLDVRNAFSNNQGTQQQDWQHQNVNSQPTGTAIVPAIPLPAGSVITTPNNDQFQQPNSEFVARNPPVQQISSDASLMKLLGSKSFMDILSPKMLNQQDAAQQLIPPLMSDGMKSTLAQQQSAIQSQNQQSQQMDPRQASMYPQGAMYPQQSAFGGQFPQQQMYGQQPMYGQQLGAMGSQLYPQTLQQPQLNNGFGLGNNGFAG